MSTKVYSYTTEEWPIRCHNCRLIRKKLWDLRLFDVDFQICMRCLMLMTSTLINAMMKEREKHA